MRRYALGVVNVVACPYGAMGYDQIDHHAVKCDLCSARRADGLRPACATACPGGAISFGERQAHLRHIEEDGRTAIDHDAFLLGPSNIFCSGKQTGVDDVMAGDTINLMDFTATDRQRPAVVDDPTRKETLLSDATAYPYRSKREDRQPDRVVAGGAISVSTVARCITISRMTSLCASPAMKMTRYGAGKSVQNHNFYCNFITVQNGSRPRLNVWGTRRRQI